MRIPRVTITHLAIVVAVVAVNLAVGRALFRHDEGMLFGLVLMGPLLQVGVFRLFRRPAASRAFWAGFVTTGLMMSASLVWAFEFGPIDRIPSEINLPVHPLSRAVTDAWIGYIWGLDDLFLGRNWGSLRFVYSATPAAHMALTLALFLPQILAALAGGLLFRLVAHWCGVRPARPKRPEVD